MNELLTNHLYLSRFLSDVLQQFPQSLWEHAGFPELWSVLRGTREHRKTKRRREEKERGGYETDKQYLVLH